jgi:hypothetical protein
MTTRLWHTAHAGAHGAPTSIRSRAYDLQSYQLVNCLEANRPILQRQVVTLPA